MNSGAVEHRYYVYGGERLVATVTRQAGAQDKTRFVHIDHLGSVDAVTDESGAVVERRSYDAFGQARNPKWGGLPLVKAPTLTRGFTGHESDAELGLVNAKGRLYDPKLGRFLTPDPVISKPHFGQSFNAYSYTLNNPLSYVDPSGFSEDDPPPAGSSWSWDPSQGWPSHMITVWIFGSKPEAKALASSLLRISNSCLGEKVGRDPQCPAFQ